MLKEIKTTTEHYFENEAGKKHGVYKQWWPNKTLRTHAYYVNNMPHGEFKTWWENGTLQVHSHHINGMLHGVYMSWHENGTLRKHAHYNNGTLVKQELK